MPIIFGKAPGKIILFGEHAVVYGQPAIAIPVNRVNATAKIFPDLNIASGGIQIRALDINLDCHLTDLEKDHPLRKAVDLTLKRILLKQTPAFTIQIESEIPVAAGMGSSAAVAIAMIRALSAFLGAPLPADEISSLAYEVEKCHHGNPSGIDNSVIAYQRPVFFIRGKPIRFLDIKKPTHWIIADSGEKTPTRETVSAVSVLHASNTQYYDSIFEQMGAITQEAQWALSKGDVISLGGLMNENQRLLELLDVSNPHLESLIQAARSAGAAGAKLSGGGRGGNMIALVQPDNINVVEKALQNAGAQQTITTILAEGRLP